MKENGSLWRKEGANGLLALSQARYSPQSGVAIGSTSSRSSRRSNSESQQIAHEASCTRFMLHQPLLQ